ncbi:hypothetical protein SCLCIDRAFT_33187 [Scleroderma citrinum Foug A]|uniref:Nephrocystin 3-like N-terminal domain-containing protein n=1 Tax=Scleroderma citrinum Foug A TaxID=1036808 RepID=A0A0C3CT55_9AGAM|nr:hypothetical protein SCLCIDRAFT_33187 [Scleroderma citrinum Foug A]
MVMVDEHETLMCVQENGSSTGVTQLSLRSVQDSSLLAETLKSYTIHSSHSGPLTRPETSHKGHLEHLVSTSPGSDGIRKRKMARLKNFLPNRSNQNIASSSTGDLLQGSTRVVPAHEIDAARKGLDTARLVVPVAQHSVELLKTFNTVVSTIADIHPYAQTALGMLTSAAQLIIMQANLDQSISSLLVKVRNVYEFLLEKVTLSSLDMMEDTLACRSLLAQVIDNCTQFFKSHSEKKKCLYVKPSSLTTFYPGSTAEKRLGKNIASETQTAVDDYKKPLDALMQQYRDRAIRDAHINVYRVLEDLNLDEGKFHRRLLTGSTPRGSSGFTARRGEESPAIAHTMALLSKNVGGLGSCFFFAGDRQTERRHEKMLSTISRDLANRDSAFRRVLAEVNEEDNVLKTTPDVMQQWEKPFLEPLSKVSGGIVGKVVLVIDALDESGADSSRKHILSVLTSTQAASFPPNFRILLTSRPLSDITRALGNAQHVKVVSLDNVPAIFTERDIRLFVSKELGGFDDTGKREINEVTQS